MKKTLLITSSIISLLSLIGCSQFEDTTSVGSDLIKEADPSFLDFDKNYQPFTLDTSIVTGYLSVPRNENDTNFGVHTASVLPVGGKNGEISTAYYEFKTSFDDWKKICSVDSLVSLTEIYSTELIFSKSTDSTNSDCNYNQDTRVLYFRDSTYKYNRNQTNVEKILSDTANVFDYSLNPADLSYEFSDSILSREILDALTMQHQQYTQLPSDSQGNYFKNSVFKPKTFQFVLASTKTDSMYALLDPKASLKVHFKRGDNGNKRSKAIVDNTLHHRDTSYTKQKRFFVKSDTVGIETAFDTLYNKPSSKGQILIDSLCKIVPETVVDTPLTDTIPIKPVVNNYRNRVKTKDSTWVIDSIVSNIDTIYSDSVITHCYTTQTNKIILVDSVDTNTISNDSLRVIRRKKSLLIDSLFDAQPSIIAITDTIKRVKITVDTIPMKADSLFILRSYSNYVMYETKETLENRLNFDTYPISSFGPQRTAVFKLDIDSLWNTLAQQPAGNGPAFNKILSAGVAITGKLDSSFIKTRSDTTDTTISVRWFVSENLINDGRLLHRTDNKDIGENETLKNGKEIVLPIEKNLQEILSRTSPSTRPSTVYLYLEALSSKNYNKQVIWSKPSLLTVLTTSTKE
ncbi:MAG TPA: hypothetical protein VHO70_18805 [Chitinispirillaceae bacterium]|nr:hypothetical protein [Chitinispirillaceae bacterium]